MTQVADKNFQAAAESLLELENRRRHAVLNGSGSEESEHLQYMQHLAKILEEVKNEGSSSVNPGYFSFLCIHAAKLRKTHVEYIYEALEAEKEIASASGIPIPTQKTIFAPTTLPPNANVIKDQAPLIRLTAPPAKGWGVLDASGLDKVSYLTTKQNHPIAPVFISSL